MVEKPMKSTFQTIATMTQMENGTLSNVLHHTPGHLYSGMTLDAQLLALLFLVKNQPKGVERIIG